MATSIPEQIAQNLLSELAAITVANGFEITLIPFRHKTDRKPESFSDHMAELIWIKRDLLRNEGGKTQWMDHYQLAVVIDQTESTTTPMDERLNKITSAVVQKLMTDPQRGSYTATSNKLAIDTLIDSSEPFPLESEYEGVVVRFRVQFRTNKFDLYNQ